VPEFGFRDELLLAEGALLDELLLEEDLEDFDLLLSRAFLAPPNGGLSFFGATTAERRFD
jgi:hypothetical protein